MTDHPVLRPDVAALPAYIAGRKADGAQVAALASNESHFPPLATVVEAVGAAAQRINRYPDMGSVALRERIATAAGLPVEAVAVGPGSVGVLAQLISALCGPGDEVIFAWRSFEAYPILAQIAGATSVRVPLTADERHDLPAMAAAVNPRTKVVLLCSPNNPTGTSITEDELHRFLAAVPSRVLVVLDEAYREYAAAPDSSALLGRYPNLALLRTFSKAYGLAGLRVGYALASPALAEGMRKTQIPFSVSNVAEAAALAALDGAEQLQDRVAAVIGERERIVPAVRELGWRLPDSTANFLWLRTTDSEREALVAAFETAAILVRGYPGDGVRITVADRAGNDRVLQVLASFPRQD